MLHEFQKCFSKILPITLVLCLCSLLNLCSVKNQDAVLKLAVSTLDYSRDGLARVILSKILTAATDVRKPQQKTYIVSYITKEHS